MLLKKKESAKRKKSIDTAEHYQLYMLAAIPMLLVFVFSYLPMGGIVIAFKDYRYNTGMFGSEWVGLRNFKFFFESKDFLNITKNTLTLNSIFIIAGMISAILIAVLLFEVSKRNLTKLYQTIMITPNFISWVVASYMVYALLNPEFGLLNAVLKSMGMKSIDWYSKPNAWPMILTIAFVWKNVGMDSIMYYAALMGISSEMLEAAEIDGAGKVKQLWYIVLPSIKTLIVILTILKIGNIFRADFGLFYQLTRDSGALYSTTDVMDTYIFRTMRVMNNMGMSAAAGLLQSAVGFVLVVLVNYIAKKIDPETGLF